MITFRKITFVHIRKPDQPELNQDIQWLGSALGLFGVRDKNSSCFRVFVELLKAAKVKKGLTSDQIAYLTDLSRGTVVHHLHRLIDAGIVGEMHHTYYLQRGKLVDIVREIQRQTNDFFQDLVNVADDVDKELQL